jgi:hypothetical protein
MNANSPPTSAEDRISALEARIAELERQCEAAQLTIPWHVICAAVAAVMPNVRIIRVTHAAPNRDAWHTSALLQNIHSHHIR